MLKRPSFALFEPSRPCFGQIHDEVILEGPEETAEEALAETVRCMEQPWDDVGLKKLRVSERLGVLVLPRPATGWCLSFVLIAVRTLGSGRVLRGVNDL